MPLQSVKKFNGFQLQNSVKVQFIKILSWVARHLDFKHMPKEKSGHYCQSLVENLVTNSGPGPAFVTKVLNKTLTSETLYCSTHLCHIFYLKSNFNFLSKLHFGKFCSIYQWIPICICVCIPLTIYFNGIHRIFEICKLVQYYYIALHSCLKGALEEI